MPDGIGTLSFLHSFAVANDQLSTLPVQITNLFLLEGLSVGGTVSRLPIRPCLSSWIAERRVGENYSDRFVSDSP